MKPPAPRPSFLAQAAAAPFLFSQQELGQEYIEDHDGAMRAGEYTAERLFARRPEVYMEIVRLLAEKASVRAIKRQCKVHHLTIAAVQEREGESIDTLRLKLGIKAMKLAAFTLENIEDALVKGKFKSGELAFLLSALVDKGQLLTGGATSRPDVSRAADVAKDLNDLLDTMPIADAEVVETHSDARGEVAVGAAGSGLPGAGSDRACRDSKSVTPLCNGGDVTAFDAAPPSEAGGEGVRKIDAPPISKDA